MAFTRASGILLHPTSLPSRHGVGDLGPEAHRFVDWLAAAGQKLWQVLPLNPTGYGDSPFQCFSAYAGNHLLISLQGLVEDGVLTASDLASAPLFPADHVDYAAAIAYKLPLLRRAAAHFFSNLPEGEAAAYEEFCVTNAAWLEDFALYMAIKDAHDLIGWTRWPGPLAARDPEVLATWRARLAPQIHAHQYWQFVFFRQWGALRDYAHQNGIQIIGDVPIYVAHDSADVWAQRDFFLLDEHGFPTVIAGVPPDYFSTTGQCWGNPIYDWPLHHKNGYQWWIARFRAALQVYDLVRIDHFRGFEAYWEVPGNQTTAINGKWVKGPGAELFRALKAALGELPVIAENLGCITPEVEAIRNEFHLPGMAILQFAYGTDPMAHTFRPHSYERNLVAYTGTHDNDTVVGWWRSGPGQGSTRTWADIAKEHDYAQAYLHFTDGDPSNPVHWVLIRGVLSSVAETAILPLQDVLGLGGEARMNLPGSPSGWWKWRAKPGAMTAELAATLREMTTLYER